MKIGRIVFIILLIINFWLIYKCNQKIKQVENALQEYILRQEEINTVSRPVIEYLGNFHLSWYSPVELGKPAHKLRTSTGKIPTSNQTIAVDPRTIPLGSRVFIENYGMFTAEDTGGSIKGNRIDIFTNNYEYAVKNGRKKAKVWVIY